MNKPQEVELFDYLSRSSRFRDWVSNRLAKEHKVLEQALDIDQVRRAQGRAQLCAEMIQLMDQQKSA